MFKIFEFLRNCIQFIKILILFSIMMLLLYWIQHLTNTYWAWSSFMNGFLDFFIQMGQNISSDSARLFEALFEYKYFIALLIFILLYAIIHLLYHAINFCEDLYNNNNEVARKKEQDYFNETLESQRFREQNRIKKYQIYIETEMKQMYVNSNCNENIENQNDILVKYLCEKFSTYPISYGNGFLFTFDSFNQIDIVLEIFDKLKYSNAPINFIICVQVINDNSKKESSQLQTLINLRLINKIVLLPDTVYRYRFNIIKTFETSLIGLFQKDGKEFEVHEFIKKN